jgi:hypothetical protein
MSDLSPGGMLELIQRLPTSGARAVEPFVVGEARYLAVPQLATDLPGQPPSLTVGNSDTELLVFRLENGRFVEHQRLPVPGGEDAESFEIGGRRFLATASLRRGEGPYEMNLASTIFEWQDGSLQAHQHIDTVAAKQWTFFGFDGRSFLALAQGAVPGGSTAPAGPPSRIYEWNGDRFTLFQDVVSAWGYNFHFFETAGERLLAYADHAVASHLLRWNGRSFEHFHDLEGSSGRAFCHFRADAEDWLVFACLLGETWLLRWADGRFVRHQRLSGPGGRELEWLESQGGGHLIQTNFIQGSREAPQPVLRSVVYAWRGGRLDLVDDFATVGGTDAAAFAVGGQTWLAVSNSLAPDLRFRSETSIYRLHLEIGMEAPSA